MAKTLPVWGLCLAVCVFCVIVLSYKSTTYYLPSPETTKQPTSFTSSAEFRRQEAMGNAFVLLWAVSSALVIACFAIQREDERRRYRRAIR